MGAPIKDLFAHYKVDANGCWIWQGSLKSTGYGVSVRHGKTKSMHRAFYEHHIGPIPEGLLVCHKCDVRNCVNPEHLFVGTNLDNIRDAMAKGRLSPTPKGESHNRAKLTEADVIEIRRLSANGWATKVLAKHYLMHSKTIRALLNGQNWKNVQPPAVQQDSEACLSKMADFGQQNGLYPEFEKQGAARDAETYLRKRYGAYRGHFAWRELEEAFNAGAGIGPSKQGVDHGG